jgi:hypothetical protein
MGVMYMKYIRNYSLQYKQLEPKIVNTHFAIV